VYVCTDKKWDLGSWNLRELQGIFEIEKDESSESSDDGEEKRLSKEQ
jgi:hypothetical protein